MLFDHYIRELYRCQEQKTVIRGQKSGQKKTPENTCRYQTDPAM